MAARRAIVRIACTLSLIAILALPACQMKQAPTGTVMKPSTPRRDINAVLRDHDDELLAIPGVAGVFVGLFGNEKTPCLKVMAEKRTRALVQRIPTHIEGYPVIVEES